MSENTGNVGVVVGLSLAVLVIAPAAWGGSGVSAADTLPAPSLRSLDLAVAVPESSVDLGGPAWSATVLTRPLIAVVPGLASEGEMADRWGNPRDLPSLIEAFGRDPSGILLEASNLEGPAFRAVPSRSPGQGATVLGLR